MAVWNQWNVILQFLTAMYECKGLRMLHVKMGQSHVMCMAENHMCMAEG